MALGSGMEFFVLPESSASTSLAQVSRGQQRDIFLRRREGERRKRRRKV